MTKHFDNISFAKAHSKKIALILVILSIGIGIKVSGLDQYLTLEALRTYRQTLLEFYHHNQALVLALYFLAYVAATALSIPGAAVMTLAGGAVFGLLAGTLIVSFASTLGATLAFLASRFILRDWVQAKLGDKLEKVNKGIEEEGYLYLFTLRLVPVFPFFAINLLMGLTNMSVRTFYIVSQIGMLPGTIVYVNAGKELGRISSLSDIMSFRLITAFALLGIMPLVAKKIVFLVKSKREKIDGQI